MDTLRAGQNDHANCHVGQRAVPGDCGISKRQRENAERTRL